MRVAEEGPCGEIAARIGRVGPLRGKELFGGALVERAHVAGMLVLGERWNGYGEASEAGQQQPCHEQRFFHRLLPLCDLRKPKRAGSPRTWPRSRSSRAGRAAPSAAW